MLGRLQVWLITIAVVLLVGSLSTQRSDYNRVAQASSFLFTNGQQASLVLGQADFDSNTATTTQNGMYYPGGVAVDPVSGKVFVADSGNNRVLRFAAINALSTNADAEGVLGQPDFTSNTAATTQSGMSYPAGITVDSTGRLWVADAANNRVLHFNNAASKSNGAPADGVLGQPDFTSGSSPGAIPRTMRFPIGVAVDATGRLWVADSRNNRVLRFDNAAAKANGADADGVLGQPDFIYNGSGYGPNFFNEPYDVAIDNAGHLWVTDATNSRVLRFDNAATKANGADADGVLGQPDLISHSYGVSQNEMDGPRGVDIDSNGRVWVAGGHPRVLWFDQAGSRANGANADGVLGQIDFTSTITGTTQFRMNELVAVAVEATGGVWVADHFNHRVLYFSPQGVETDTPTHTPTNTSTKTSTATPTRTNTPTRQLDAYLPVILNPGVPSPTATSTKRPILNHYTNANTGGSAAQFHPLCGC